MNPEQARNTARRIVRLWPDTTKGLEQTIAKAFERNDFEEESVMKATNDLYMHNSKDFSFNDLRRKLGHAVPVRREQPVDADTLPNSPEAQSQRRHAEMEQRRIIQEKWSEAYTHVYGMEPKDVKSEFATFLTTIDQSSRAIYSDLFMDGKLPKTFVGWLYERETGKAVAL